MENGNKILVIEDSQTQALKLCAMLEEEGLSADSAESAEDAFQYLTENRPDLIVVDFHLPGMDGGEFCRQIRMNAHTETIPLLILTGDTQLDVERQGLESGADDHIPKSIDSDALLTRIQTLLRKPQTRTLIEGEGFFQQMHVLAVDDSPTYLTFLEEFLSQEGYEVTAVSSGREALQELQKNHFHCALVDFVMPEMDGIDLSKEMDMYRRKLGLNFPILMVTNKDSKEDMMQAFEAGADDFVSKSSDITILKARLRTLLRRKVLLDENERISSEFRNKELEVLSERAQKEAAEAKAAMAEELAEANRKLQQKHDELRETQAQLIHSAKMASLGELVAGIAHEINNPLAFVMNHLTTVKGRLAKLAPSVAESLNEEQQGYLKKAQLRLNDMEEGLARVKDLVIKLRTFSRIDEDTVKSSNVHDGIDSALRLLNHRYKDRIEIVKNYGEQSMLTCQPGPLNQVIINLLSNAIDAIEGEGKGTITIATDIVDGEWYEITVADSGAGIPEEIQDRIFEPFFTTKDVGSGTGLGLSISYKVVQAHNGTLTVEPGPDGGTLFTIRLPIPQEA